MNQVGDIIVITAKDWKGLRGKIIALPQEGGNIYEVGPEYQGAPFVHGGRLGLIHGEFHNASKCFMGG